MIPYYFMENHLLIFDYLILKKINVTDIKYINTDYLIIYNRIWFKYFAKKSKIKFTSSIEIILKKSI